MEKNLKAIKFLLSIIVCQMTGFIGSIFTMPAITGWYVSVKKPDFIPPSWVFSFVWIILFFLMGLALYLAWDKEIENKELKKRAVGLFVLQLILNIWWSVIFFGLKSPFFAFAEIIALWLAILANIIFFARISKLAAFLLVPYILWVSFAALLNFLIWQMN